MARPRASERQKIRANDLWRLSTGPSAILETLEEEWGDASVSMRTIMRWLSEFRKDDPEEIFSWQNLDEKGLPWEASEVLLLTWKEALRFERALKSVGIVGLPKPTFRHAIWWWRIYCGIKLELFKGDPAKDDPEPRIRLMDVFLFANHYVHRERVHRLLGRPLFLDDLNAYLMFRPWWSSKNLDEYKLAIKHSQVPALRHPYQEFFIAPEAVSQIPASWLLFGMHPRSLRLTPLEHFNQFKKEAARPVNEQRDHFFGWLSKQPNKLAIPLEDHIQFLERIDSTSKGIKRYPFWIWIFLREDEENERLNN